MNQQKWEQRVSLYTLSFHHTFEGIPHTQRITLDAFRSKLHSQFDHQVTLSSLRLNSSKQMARIEQTKRGLTDLYVKFQVSQDRISCTPLKRDGKYM